MGLFDKMFGGGASEAEQQQGAQQRFNELKQKYQSVLNMADQQHIQFQVGNGRRLLHYIFAAEVIATLLQNMN